jgi:amino acid transporter
MSVRRNDENLLASLGYKQEFQRHFSHVEVFGQAFNTFGIVPSLISVLIYAVPYGGTSSLVWGWAVGSILVFFVGLSIAELGSAAPTSGSVR